MAHQYVFGLLGSRCTGNARKVWNACIGQEGIDGFFDFYPTTTVRDLELRLAEMFHLGRRAYLLSEPLRAFVRPLLDGVDDSVGVDDDIDTVINRGGILVGFCLRNLPPEQQLARWISESASVLSD